MDGNLIDGRTLAQQLRFLKKRYVVIDPQLAREGLRDPSAMPRGAVLLTCDDGLTNCLTEMLPVLQEEGVSCLFFPTVPDPDRSRLLWHEELFLLLRAAAGQSVEGLGGLPDRLPTDEGRRRTTWRMLMRALGGRPSTERAAAIARIAEEAKLGDGWLEEMLGGAGAADRFITLDFDGLKALASSGMTLGSHTLSHPILSLLEPAVAMEELGESRAQLAAAVSEDIWALAYPFGDSASVGVRERRLAADTGYEVAFRNWGGISSGWGDPHFVPRVSVTADMSMTAFHARTSGMYEHMMSAARRLIGRTR